MGVADDGGNNFSDVTVFVVLTSSPRKSPTLKDKLSKFQNNFKNVETRCFSHNNIIIVMIGNIFLKKFSHRG